MRRLAIVATALWLTSCGSPRTTAPATSAAVEPALTGRLTVFAASSLTESFTDLGKRLETANPGFKVTFNFAASSALVTQIQQGAQADIVATADEANMLKLTPSIETPAVFARNRLAIVVQKGNPKQIGSLADLAKSGLVVVLCGAQVPCGKFADQALTMANVTVKAASREENVKAVLTKVQLGEADAGIVYVTDVKAGGDKVEGVDIPDSQNVLARYPMAIVKTTANDAAARGFVDFVASASGSATLQRYGFLSAA